MRDGAPTEVVRYSAAWVPTMSSWFNGSLLADDIPIDSGTVYCDRANAVPERITVTVPRFSVVDGDQFDWMPGDDFEHPLAKFGQQLQLSVIVTAPRTGMTYQTQMGVFTIQSWAETGDGAIQVEAAGVLQLAADDSFVTPQASGGTFQSQFLKLLPITLRGAVDGALEDRTCPNTFNWAEDRLTAIYELADAWPARVRTDDAGVIRLLPTLPATPDPILQFTDGEDGTLVSAPRSDTRAGTANRVTAESDNGTTVTVSQLTGPMSVNGPYGVITYRFSSGALTTEAEVTAAAEAKLSDLLRGTRTLTITAVPDPRVDLDDPVAVTRDGVTVWGWVDSYEIPLTVNDGPMVLVVSVS